MADGAVAARNEMTIQLVRWNGFQWISTHGIGWISIRISGRHGGLPLHELGLGSAGACGKGRRYGGVSRSGSALPLGRVCHSGGAAVTAETAVTARGTGLGGTGFEPTEKRSANSSHNNRPGPGATNRMSAVAGIGEVGDRAAFFRNDKLINL